MNLTSVLLLMGFSFLSIFGCTPSAQSSGAETPEEKQAAFASHPDALYPIRVKDKWGYMNRKGDIVIAPQYEDADDFEEGLASVSIYKNDNQYYGYIDTKGRMVIEPIYSRAGKMREGIAVVAKDDQ